MNTVKVPSSSTEKLSLPITTTADPTGDDVEWSFTAVDAAPVSWSAGAWESAGWNATTSTAEALSPLVPGLLADGTYKVWVRWTVGQENPVRQAGWLIIS